MDNKVDSIKLRQYLRNRRKELDHEKTLVMTSSAKRSINSAVSELMFIEEHLDNIDPIGKKMFIKLKDDKKSYK